jgi:hypothetical protein
VASQPEAGWLKGQAAMFGAALGGFRRGVACNVQDTGLPEASLQFQYPLISVVQILIHYTLGDCTHP